MYLIQDCSKLAFVNQMFLKIYKNLILKAKFGDEASLATHARSRRTFSVQTDCWKHHNIL